MTTQHIQGIEALAQAAKVVTDSATQRARELREQQERADAAAQSTLANLAVAARAVNRRHIDDSTVRNEELAQVDEILGNVPAAPAPVAPAAAPQANTDLPAPVVATPPPPPSTQVVPQTEVPVRRFADSPANPGNWNTWLPWVLAGIGAFIALLIVNANLEESLFDSFGSFLIWIGAFVLGGGIGGTIGALIDERRHLNIAQQPADVVIVQATPDTPQPVVAQTVPTAPQQ